MCCNHLNLCNMEMLGTSVTIVTHRNVFGNIYIPVWTKNIASHAKSILFTTAFLAVFLVF